MEARKPDVKPLRHALTAPVRAQARHLADGWNRFWFTPADPTTLGAIRICTGLTLLYVYLACTPALLDFIGPHAWVDARAMEQVHGLGQDAPSAWQRMAQGSWGWSVWTYIRQPALIWVVHAGFLGALVCYTLGLYARTSAVVVWLGHLSFVHRSFMTWFGMDSILAMMTFYLLFGPTGAALSLDSVRARRRGRTAGPKPSWPANLVIRAIQVHVCVVYLCAGLAKLQGARWWDGTAVWLVLLQPEMAPHDLGWLAWLGDWPCLLLSNLGVLLTLFMEIGFAFLIWNRTLRPLMLLLAVLLHAGIGLFMAMDAFGAIMLTGCLSFVSPAALRGCLDKLGKRCVRLQPGADRPRQCRRAA